jgi:hypothetical protein
VEDTVVLIILGDLLQVNQLAAAVDAGGSNATAFRLFNASSDKSGFSNLNINDPFKAERLFNGSLTGSFSKCGWWCNLVATSYDGFTILSSGTITGTVRCTVTTTKIRNT